MAGCYGLWPISDLYNRNHVWDSNIAARGIPNSQSEEPWVCLYVLLLFIPVGVMLIFDSFSTFQTNLLTIPSTVAGLFTLIGITLISEAVDSRSFVSMAEDSWALPCLIALYSLPVHPNPWSYYVRLVIFQKEILTHCSFLFRPSQLCYFRTHMWVI